MVLVRDIIKRNFSSHKPYLIKTTRTASLSSQLVYRYLATEMSIQQVGDDLSVYMLNLFFVIQHPSKFSNRKSWQKGDIDFSNCRVTLRWLRDQRVMWL